MRKLYYDRLQSNRIRGYFLGLLFIFANITVVIYRPHVTPYQYVLFSVVAYLVIALFYVLGVKSFAKVIEKNIDGQVATYYKLGRKKLKYRTLGQLMQVELQQDTDKYYCLILKMNEGHNIVLEKYPSLNEASRRLDDVRMIFQ